MKKGIILAIGLLVGGVAVLAGCKSQGSNAGIPVGPKWKGLPYRLTFDTKAAKSGAVLPGIQYTANPDALETRAILAIRFDDLGDTKTTPPSNKMFIYPTDISGAQGALSADYIKAANEQLSEFFKNYCVKGKVKMSVALVRSSLNTEAGDAEVDQMRMSDWMPIATVVKSTRPGCGLASRSKQ